MRHCYIVTPSLIGSVHTQNGPPIPEKYRDWRIAGSAAKYSMYYRHAMKWLTGGLNTALTTVSDKCVHHMYIALVECWTVSLHNPKENKLPDVGTVQGNWYLRNVKNSIRLQEPTIHCEWGNPNMSWRRHQIGTYSALLALCAGNSTVTDELSSKRPVTRSFDVFFDLRLNKRLSKQSRGWWFETP